MSSDDEFVMVDYGSGVDSGSGIDSGSGVESVPEKVDTTIAEPDENIQDSNEISVNNLIDENIENYKSIYDKRSNIFLNENGIDELINEIFEEINMDEDNIFNILIDNEYESD